MWPSPEPLRSWAVVAAHPSAILCWLKVVAHPLFRRAIRGHWRLSEVWRSSVAEHVADLAQYVDPTSAPDLRTYCDAQGAAKCTWTFRIDNDWFGGRAGPGLRRALKGDSYEFIFDAATTRLLWAKRYEWRGF